MIDLDAVIPKLAALFYYQAPKRTDAEGKFDSFEALDETAQRPWLEMARGVLIALDKLNLTVTRRSPLTPAEVRTLFRAKVERIVHDLLRGITRWKREYFPADELIAQITQLYDED